MRADIQPAVRKSLSFQVYFELFTIDFCYKISSNNLKKIIILIVASECSNWWMLHITENLVRCQTWIKLNGFGELVGKLETDEECFFIEESQHGGGKYKS